MNKPLPRRKCKRKGCEKEFQKRKPLDMFCSPMCADLHSRDLAAKREDREGPKKSYRIPQISQKRLDENAAYRVERDKFMSDPANKWCPVMLYLSNEKVRTKDLHHMNGRTGKRLLDSDYWLAVSREGHNWIHEHPAEARKKGWLI